MPWDHVLHEVCPETRPQAATLAKPAGADKPRRSREIRKQDERARPADRSRRNSLRRESAGGFGQRRLGRDRGPPAQRRPGRPVIDLQRQGQAAESGSEKRQAAQPGKDRLRQREQDCLSTLGSGENADQLGGGQVGSVADQQDRAASGRGNARMRAAGGDQIDQVVARDQAAAVVETGERQRQAAPARRSSARKLPPTPGP